MEGTRDADFELTGFLPYMLNMAAEAASAGFQPAYRERYGMLRTEWRIMAHLARFGEMTAGDIGRRARIHKTKISRGVRALEAKRLLVRRVAPHDRRAEILGLSRAGVEAFRALSAVALTYDAGLWSRFDPQDAAALRRCLTALIHAPPVSVGAPREE